MCICVEVGVLVGWGREGVCWWWDHLQLADEKPRCSPHHPFLLVCLPQHAPNTHTHTHTYSSSHTHTYCSSHTHILPHTHTHTHPKTPVITQLSVTQILIFLLLQCPIYISNCSRSSCNTCKNVVILINIFLWTYLRAKNKMSELQSARTSIILFLHQHSYTHTIPWIPRPLIGARDTSTQQEKPAEASACGGMWRCQTWKCQTVCTHQPEPLLSICCMCARALVCTVCVRGRLSPLNSKVSKWQGQAVTVQLLPPGRLETGASLHLTTPPPLSLCLSLPPSLHVVTAVTGPAGS